MSRASSVRESVVSVWEAVSKLAFPAVLDAAAFSGAVEPSATSCQKHSRLFSLEDRGPLGRRAWWISPVLPYRQVDV